jgi:hypothetical protein
VAGGRGTCWDCGDGRAMVGGMGFLGGVSRGETGETVRGTP